MRLSLPFEVSHLMWCTCALTWSLGVLTHWCRIAVGCGCYWSCRRRADAVGNVADCVYYFIRNNCVFILWQCEFWLCKFVFADYFSVCVRHSHAWSIRCGTLHFDVFEFACACFRHPVTIFVVLWVLRFSYVTIHALWFRNSLSRFSFRASCRLCILLFTNDCGDLFSVGIVFVGVAHLFCDLTPPIESHMRENNGKNTVGPNEFTDFEKFEVEHPENTKTVLARTGPINPVTVLLFGGIALRVV